jgi:hypothetical protein
LVTHYTDYEFPTHNVFMHADIEFWPALRQRPNLQQGTDIRFLNRAVIRAKNKSQSYTMPSGTVQSGYRRMFIRYNLLVSILRGYGDEIKDWKFRGSNPGRGKIFFSEGPDQL